LHKQPVLTTIFLISMRPILRFSVTALVLVNLVCVVCACTDHISTPLSPLRQRLKTVVTDGLLIDGKITPLYLTTFEYDTQNRQAGYSNLNYSRPGFSSHGTILYDAQGQYQRIDEENKDNLSVTTMTTLFTYQPDGQGGKLIRASSYFGSQPTVGQPFNQQIIYQMDANNHLIRSDFFQYPGAVPNSYVYTYTGENITQAEAIGQGRIITYTYDDKPNPFYRIVGFIIQGTSLEGAPGRFSHNNLVSSTINGGAGGGGTDGLEYNAQGLLSRIQVSSLTYESY
jgi:hypothetical protein